ncbi:uncharacterized protein LOC141619181 [Silene latifolia]|uniref:uncharacterized protein LOC141619181 n=1 Tax=Silene latifolia TaxID=37657 RepID=UPI003D77717B
MRHLFQAPPWPVSTGGRKKLFRFDQIWLREDGCEEAIRMAWEQDSGGIIENLAQCSKALQEWKEISIGKVLRDLQNKRNKLRKLNEGCRSRWAVRERKKVVKEIANLLKQEETFWRQRSRALWLRDGDQNTKYFHRKPSQRKKKNFIARLVDDEGRNYVGTEVVASVAKGYFDGLFTSSSPTDFEETLDVVEGRLTSEMNDFLCEDYREEEVINALNQMHPLKPPGLDGMNVLFYQTY